jgi:hypothetical protein
MRSFRISAVFGVLLGVLAFTACGGSGAPSAAPAFEAPAVGFGDDAAILNVAGQYSGTVHDSAFGKGKVTASLAQDRSAVGGDFVQVYSAGKANSSLAALATGNAARGISVATVLGVACSFNFTGKYNAKTFVLSGGYKAVHGCSGESGTYTMKERCSYVRAWDIRPETGPKPC